MRQKLAQILLKWYGNTKALEEIWTLFKPKKRSLDQNSLYWLFLTCLQQELGQDKNELHLYFKQKYLEKQYIQVFGENIEKEITTTKLTTGQFKEYLDKIQIFAQQELNIVLPDPNDKRFEEFRRFYENYL